MTDAASMSPPATAQGASRPRFALVAGEASGDLLGASLMRALRQHFPEASFYGVAGPRMREAGCEVVAPVEELSVMGLVEVLRHLPRILRLRRTLTARILEDRPDAYIGIDAPDFNLGLATRLRARGLRTVQLVSPTVWAWRESRVRTVARAVDLVLCLFPFEARFYEGRQVHAAYIGHPLADELDDSGTAEAARAALGLPAQGPVVAVLPGSRRSELQRLAGPFAGTAAWIAERRPETRFVVPVASAELRGPMAQAIARHAPGAHWHLLDEQSRTAMRAADVVLLASGTATLECLLLGRPMVVGYRAAPLTAWLLREMGMLKVRHVSQPNLLAAEPVVPEFLQEQARPDRLGPEVLKLLQEPALRERQLAQFGAVRAELRRNAGVQAAGAIAQLLGR